ISMTFRMFLLLLAYPGSSGAVISGSSDLVVPCTFWGLGTIISFSAIAALGLVLFFLATGGSFLGAGLCVVPVPGLALWVRLCCVVVFCFAVDGAGFLGV